MSTVTREDRYIMSDIEANNNKFWNIIQYSDNAITTKWGRVGEEGQSKNFSHGSSYEADKFYSSKCKEKERKGYVKQKTISGTSTTKVESVSHSNLAEVAKKQIQTNNPLVLKLVDYLSKVNVHSILQATSLAYDTSKGTFSTPLGIVTKDAIDEARNLLTNIADFVVKKDWDNPGINKFINSYLMLIPQNIGRGKPNPKNLYPDINAIQEQNGILDSLDASLQMVLSSSSDKGKKIDSPKLFNARLDLVEDGKEIDRIRKKYKSTLQSMHACAHLDVKKVYAIEIAHMKEAFEKVGKKVGTIWELYHGTKASNLLSILKSGFVMPQSSGGLSLAITGAMFGAGCYFSDQSTKSLNYAYGYWGGNKDNNCFMLLNDVAMGKFFVPSGPSNSFPKKGYDSTYAKAGQSGVMNNEMIVYDTRQINPKFLVEFSPNGK